MTDTWQRWYNNLTRKQKIRYHIGIKESRLGDWVVTRENRLLKYVWYNDAFWAAEEFFFIKVPCLLTGHYGEHRGDWTGIDHCIYCGKRIQ